MQQLPQSLAALAEYRQFILYKLVWEETKQHYKKIPISPHTLMAYPKNSNWQKNPDETTDAATALSAANAMGESYGVGFLFTVNDPFFFVDLDKCLEPDNATWSPVAMEIIARLPGAAVEVSQSGRGLHIFGRGACPEHGCKNVPLGIELYTEGRFAALTGTNAIGDAGLDCSAVLPALVDGYFPPKVTNGRSTDWTTEPVAQWGGLEDDDELIAKAMASSSAAGAFGNRSTFATLWEGDEASLGGAYPDPEGLRPYDGSSADAALAQHLAFWTGNNCDRIFRLMWLSGLVRDKWNREDYLIRTITRAASLQETFYTGGKTPLDPAGQAIAEQHGAPKLRANTDAQRNYANTIRAQKLAIATEEEAKNLCSNSGLNATAKFWLDNQERTPAQLVAMVTPIESAANPLGSVSGPEIAEGYQYLGASLQLEHFAGCVYIQAPHKIFTPGGALLKSEQFNATYGGYVFQLDETGDKTTRKAWDAFTESQIIRYPKAQAMCFRPLLPSGQLIEEEGVTLVNTYVPIETPRQEGDVTPFLNHLAKLLPNERDRSILLAYMAACIQHKGVKFQWAPLIQGAEGNGKTLLTRCVAYAVGRRYTHLPPANEIAEKFNEWLFNKLFIGIEDIYVPDHKKEIIEVLKPMITNDELAMRAMQQGQVMMDNFANFMLNSNHRDAWRKTRNDRRIAIFYTAQQSLEDIERDHMSGDYFPNLYDWLKLRGGYAIVANYMANYQIPDELNPAGQCHRAPITSSTEEAVTASMGGVEQEIVEAIEEGRPGFAGGWVSSMAVERLLQIQRMGRAIPRNKRRELMQSLGYDYHPALKDGRVNNFIPFDAGKPRIFIQNGHIHSNLTSAAEVARLYQEAQGGPIAAGPMAAGGAAAVFGQ